MKIISMNKKLYFSALKNGFFVILLGLILFPFLWISFFAVPSVDDYIAPGNSIIMGYFNFQLSQYTHWNGRYVATALQSIPVVTNFWIYRFTPLLIFLLFVNSFYLLFKTVRPFDYYSKFERLLISLGILALYLTHIVSASNFYWFSGSVTYILPLILLNYFLVCLYKIFIENDKKIINIFLVSFLVFLMIGTGEVIMVFLDMLLFIFFLVSFLKDKKFKFNWILFFLGVIALISSMILVLAPGNSARESLVPFARNFNFAIGTSLGAILKYGYKWMFGKSSLWLMGFPILFLLCRAFSKQQEQVLEKLNDYLINPFLAFFLWFILMAASFFVPYYAVGNHVLDRTVAIIQLLFYLGFFYVLCTVAFYITKHYRNNLNSTISQKIIRVSSCIFFILAIISLYLFSTNLQKSYEDMISGKSSNFYYANKEIRNMILSRSDGEIFVPGKIDVPKLTSFEGKTNTLRMAEFFGKNVKIAHDLSLGDYYIAEKYAAISADNQEINVYFDKTSNSIVYKASKSSNLENKRFYVEITYNNKKEQIKKEVFDWNYEESEINGYLYYVFYLSDKIINGIYTYQLDQKGNKYWEKTVI